MKDRYLRTLVRNTYSFHLKEIFATVQNEYTDWTESNVSNFESQYEASRAITDKLYTAPIRKTATWATDSGHQVFLYVNGYLSGQPSKVSVSVKVSLLESRTKSNFLTAPGTTK